MEKQEIINEKEEILKKISELIPQAPIYWAASIAVLMGKKQKTIYAYANGERGVRSGHHKHVLLYLKEMVAEEKKLTQKLLS